MDIYDPGLMAANARTDGTATPTGDDPANKTELDQNVEKLVGNISNWWTGFAKKSQDSITQARKEMETRGGIVNYAKSEYAKLESSIGEAQKKARDQSQQAPEAKQESSVGLSSADVNAAAPSEVSKGKRREVDDQGSTAGAQGDEAGTDRGPTLGTSVSSLFSKLTSDPRLVQLQHSLTSTLQSVSTPTAGSKELKGADGSGKAPINLQDSLSKLSLTIQSHLPHLDLKESQQLASRYIQATESFAKEVQSDMKEFVGELVRIVPPEEKGAEAHLSTAASSEIDNKETSGTDKTNTSPAADAQNKQTSKATSVSTDPTAKQADAVAADEEDFAWDEDDEEAAATSTEAAVTTVPAASSTNKQAEQPPTSSATSATEANPAETKAEESDEDSDWE